MRNPWYSHTRMKLELRNIHFSQHFSHETNCFDGVIYADGKKIGTIENDGQGGPDLVLIQDPAVNKAFFDQLKATYPGQIEPEQSWSTDILAKWEEDKQYRRWCKKMLCFRLPEDKPGEWRTMRGPAALTPQCREQVIKKYGDKVEFLNDRFQ